MTWWKEHHLLVVSCGGINFTNLSLRMVTSEGRVFDCGIREGIPTTEKYLSVARHFHIILHFNSVAFEFVSVSIIVQE